MKLVYLENITNSINDLELKLIFDMVIDGRKYNLSLFFVVVVLMMLIF